MNRRVLVSIVAVQALVIAGLVLAVGRSPDPDGAAWGIARLAAQATAPEVEYLASENPGVPFSAAVRVGRMLYLSGQLGNRPGTLAVVPGGIAAETRQTMENIKATLERAGSSMNRVVKCTAFLADMSEWSAMNEVYVSYFSENLPARSAFGTTGLALGARLELECLATVG